MYLLFSKYKFNNWFLKNKENSPKNTHKIQEFNLLFLRAWNQINKFFNQLDVCFKKHNYKMLMIGKPYCLLLCVG